MNKTGSIKGVIQGGKAEPELNDTNYTQAYTAATPFGVLIDRYKNRLYSLVLPIVGSNADAEDVVQDAFIKAHNGLKNLRSESSIGVWLRRIAYNLAIDYRRKAYRKHEVSAEGVIEITGEYSEPQDGGQSYSHRTVDLSHIESSGGDPQGMVLQQETAGVLQKVLSELSEEHRAVLSLREMEGLSYDDIAKVTGVNVGTVMSRLHYARKKIQSALAEYESKI